MCRAASGTGGTSALHNAAKATTSDRLVDARAPQIQEPPGQGFRIHTRVWRRKSENLRRAVLRGDQLVVLFGSEIQQDAAMTDFNSPVETDAVFVIYDCSAAHS